MEEMSKDRVYVVGWDENGKAIMVTDEAARIVKAVCCRLHDLNMAQEMYKKAMEATNEEIERYAKVNAASRIGANAKVLQ